MACFWHETSWQLKTNEFAFILWIPSKTQPLFRQIWPNFVRCTLIMNKGCLDGKPSPVRSQVLNFFGSPVRSGLLIRIEPLGPGPTGFSPWIPDYEFDQYKSNTGCFHEYSWFWRILGQMSIKVSDRWKKIHSLVFKDTQNIIFCTFLDSNLHFRSNRSIVIET